MSDPIRFPEYGQGGDLIGNRRQRRTFRYFVALCLLGAITAWTLEYIKYDRSETQYRMALAHYDASARPILRKVVSREEETKDLPSTRYLAALAAVEEEDRVLPVYGRAFAVNPNDPALLIKYGVELYFAGEYKDARERFREAGIEPPDNALPHFLEAAAMVAANPEIESLAAPLEVLNDAKPDTYPIIFPTPMWHPSWPRDSAWYWDKQRRIVDRTMAPIVRLMNTMSGRIRTEIRSGEVEVARAWLSEVRVMGAALLGDSTTADEHLGLSRALLGMDFERQAIQLLAETSREDGASLDPALGLRAERLTESIQRLQAFDEERQAWIASEKKLRQHAIPLALKTFIYLVVLSLVLTLATRIAGGSKKAWGLRHTGLTVSVLLFSLFVLFVLLWQISHPSPLSTSLLRETTLWNLVSIAVCVYALIYPFLRLPSAAHSAERVSESETDMETLLPLARRARVLAHLTLSRRIVGLFIGGLLCVYAAWFVSFRIVDAYYPYQVQLLVSAHRDAEVAEIRAVQAQLK